MKVNYNSNSFSIRSDVVHRLCYSFMIMNGYFEIFEVHIRDQNCACESPRGYLANLCTDEGVNPVKFIPKTAA